MKKCCIVFGVSGVGKTTLCEAYLSRHPNWLFVSASTLLKNAKQQKTEDLRTAKSENIIDNQSVIRTELQKFRSGQENRPIMVDAHGVIDNDHELVEVPVEAIASLKPDILILLEDTAENISRNRLSDKSRNRPVRSLEFIENEIAKERQVVENFSKTLGKKLYILREDKENNFKTCLDNL